MDLNIPEAGRKVSSTEREKRYGEMGRFMREISTMATNTGWESSRGKTVQPMLASSNVIT